MSEQRKQYLITLYFTDLDENMNTKYQAHMEFPDTYADNVEHARLLAARLEKRLGADYYQVTE
jgi:hypothetical protein